MLPLPVVVLVLGSVVKYAAVVTKSCNIIPYQAKSSEVANTLEELIEGGVAVGNGFEVDVIQDYVVR